MKAEIDANGMDLEQALHAAMRRGELLLDEASRRLYAQDIYSRGPLARMVLKPDDREELAAALTLLQADGMSVTPHGGGMSYTGGLLPADENTAVISLDRMNRVLEINREDMTVTVECGCSWRKLHEALCEHGLRTPFWGPLSGIRATVGGSLSQNALFWGSGQYGSAADSVLSLTVVLSDGSILETGSASQRNGSPFFRYFGPDLTGLFCADSGALGVKAVATLRLMPEMPARAYLAFDFSSGEDTVAAMSEISRQNLASECFAFDPFLQSQRLKRQGLRADAKALAGVMKASGSILGAVRDGARVALAGRGYMDDVEWSVQVIVEDRIEAGAQARADAVRAICERLGGREIENSIPKITRANPFGPVNAMLGPEGERWLPIHGLLPHSRAPEVLRRIEELFARDGEKSRALGVGMGYLFATVSTNCFVIEPVFFWPDEWLEIHRDAVEPSHLARLPKPAENLQAREHVAALRRELIDLLSELGAAHTQLARSYHYRDALKPEAARLIDAIKNAADPAGTMNPGSLGL
ncbi:MAG: FAD/FMN-containing dehydrogenase [Halieaceae bacterium]|jgi:FAD/FMN-containing dehydrogenase